MNQVYHKFVINNLSISLKQLYYISDEFLRYESAGLYARLDLLKICESCV